MFYTCLSFCSREAQNAPGQGVCIPACTWAGVGRVGDRTEGIHSLIPEEVTEAGGTHPTGTHSCINREFCLRTRPCLKILGNKSYQLGLELTWKFY